MVLKEYLKKRNLKKSGEPKMNKVRSQKSDVRGRKSIKNIFVIQEHNASHLHWDLRLEMNGVLKSWALPKIPPKTKGIKRLAIHVEDHPLSYAKFEGEIKEGYGKGSVKIWDKGTYELIEDEVGTRRVYPDKSSKKISTKGNKIEFEIFGKKLKGKYVLVNAKLGGKKTNWLFIKI